MRKNLKFLAPIFALLVIGMLGIACGGGDDYECTGPDDCTGNDYCDMTTHTCKCNPSCTGVCGGDDGCGGTCADNCTGGQTCSGAPDYVCEGTCTPSCTGKCGGPDGCDGTCPDTCTGGQICSGTPNYVCEDPGGCTNGTTQCSGTIVQTCTNEAWVNGINCATAGELCINGECVAQGTCTNGAVQCLGTVPQTCVSEAWVSGTDCANSGEICVNGVCEAGGSGGLGDPCPGGDPDCDAAYPTCLSDGEDFSMCSLACSIDSDCGVDNCCEDLGEVGHFCLPTEACPGENALGSPCEFDMDENGSPINAGTGNCGEDLICLGLDEDPEYSCGVDGDCLDTFLESWNPDCVNGGCGASFCAPSCDTVACPEGWDPQDLTSGCVCVPAAPVGTAGPGEQCQSDPTPNADNCQAGLICLYGETDSFCSTDCTGTTDTSCETDFPGGCCADISGTGAGQFYCLPAAYCG